MGYSCFFISPIKGEGSPERRLSNKILNHALRNANGLPALGFEKNVVCRGDELSGGRAGETMLAEIIRHIQEDDLCVADLTGNNPNVLYECGIRRTAGKPLVLIAQLDQHGNLSSLPSDISSDRVIPYDYALQPTVTLTTEERTALAILMAELNTKVSGFPSLNQNPPPQTAPEDAGKGETPPAAKPVQVVQQEPQASAKQKSSADDALKMRLLFQAFGGSNKVSAEDTDKGETPPAAKPGQVAGQEQQAPAQQQPTVSEAEVDEAIRQVDGGINRAFRKALNAKNVPLAEAMLPRLSQSHNLARFSEQVEKLTDLGSEKAWKELKSCLENSLKGRSRLSSNELSQAVGHYVRFCFRHNLEPDELPWIYDYLERAKCCYIFPLLPSVNDYLVEMYYGAYMTSNDADYLGKVHLQANRITIDSTDSTSTSFGTEFTSHPFLTVLFRREIRYSEYAFSHLNSSIMEMCDNALEHDPDDAWLCLAYEVYKEARYTDDANAVRERLKKVNSFKADKLD